MYLAKKSPNIPSKITKVEKQGLIILIEDIIQQYLE